MGWLSKADHFAIHDAKLTANGRPEKEQKKPRIFNEDFVNRIHTAITKGDLSVRRATSLLDTTIEDLADLFRSYKLAVPYDL